MHKKSILWTPLIVLSTQLVTAGQVLPLKELAAQRIINEKELTLNYLPGYFNELGIGINQLPLEIQQIFLTAIKSKFGRQLDRLFFQTKPNYISMRYSPMVESPDSKFTVTVFHTIANVQDTITHEVMFQLIGHDNNIRAIAISPDNKFIVTGSADNTAKIWDSTNGKLKFTLSNHTKLINSVAISSDNNFIVTGSADNTAKIWNSNTGQLLLTLIGHTKWVKSVAISPDKKFIVTGSGDATARVWDSNTGEIKITLISHNGWVEAVIVSPDNKSIVTGYWDGTAQVWDSTTGQLKATLNGHAGPIDSVAISPNNKFIITHSTDDATTTVWDTHYLFNTITLEELLEYITNNLSKP